MVERNDSAGLDVEVLLEHAPWQQDVPDVEALCRTAAVTAHVHGAPPGLPRTGIPSSVCILLAGDARIRELNSLFRGRDEPTNVLAFPGVAPDVLAAAGADGLPAMLGDVVIAYETSAGEARRDGIPLADHLSHLVVHAILHLMGYDHETDPGAVEMEGLEVRILALLGIADPYATADRQR